jgi:hypothetical protein
MASNITIVGEVLNTDIINRYPLQDERLLLPSVQQETFGASNDYIEFYVFDLGGSVLNTNYNYQSYKLPSNVGYSQSLLPVLEIDPIQDIRNLGYESGEVTTRYNFFRKISGEPFSNQLFIQQISTDRTEVRVNSTILTNDQLLSIVSSFTQRQATVPYYYYVILNFGSNNQSIAVNAVSDVDSDGNASILFKLANPLPNNIALKDTFWVVEEIVNPYIFDLNLDKLITPPPQPRLKGPNFDIDLELKNVVPTPYNNYNQLVSSLTGSYYQVVLNVINNQNTNINIDFSVLNDFIHYSSAENRVYNFMYKIGEITSYQAEINNNSPLTASNPSLVSSVTRASSSINEIISKFDGFEYYLYYTSSSLTSSIVEYTLETGSFFEYNIAPYPKTNSTQPYTLYPSASSTAQNWFFSASEVAVAYDINNKDILLGSIPSYITDDPSNYLPYLTFVNMIGQYFDNVWIYIDKLTDLWDNNNNLNRGISQDLVYDWLQSFGMKLYNSQGDQTVLDYQVGGYSGSVDFNGDYSPSSSFLNNVPRKDLTLDSYKRLYHNLPYLFKAKGAHGGLEGLITLFGITGSILPIKEYGGMTDSQELKGYTTDKINIGSNIITGSVLSPIKRLETSPTSSRAVKSQDLHFIDVSFSPETQIDAAVSASIVAINPNWILDDYIGDPRDLQLNTYPSLSYEREYWFGQTFNEPFDYGGFIRLIQFFDNSLFKMVKDFTPARGNTWTGVSIKSPVLERPKVAQYQPLFFRTNEFSATPESASLEPVYDPYYYYLAGDKADYYNGNIPGSSLDTYLVFQENNRNPFLVDNTIGYIPPGFISGNTDFVLNYDSPRPENFFLNSDFNVLQNNVDVSLTSEYRKKLIPILSTDALGRNFTSYSISGSVELQDSYLSLTAYTRPRYSGVQLYGRQFNTWSVGDNSYGQSPVINYNVKKLGLFTEVVENRYLPYKTNATLKYLVNESGSLTELNLRNRNWEEVQNTFETGDFLNVSLFDPKKFGNQIQTNGNKLIAESGYSYFPIFYAYGSESAPANWTASAVFNSVVGSSSNIVNRYFTVFASSGSLVPVGQLGSPYVSSSYSAAGTVNMQEVWNLFNITGSNTSFGGYFFTGSGPGGTSFNSTSSYYQIPAEGIYQFTYDFNIQTTASIINPANTFTASMELWLSSSTGTYTLLDQNKQTVAYQGGYYNAVLENLPNGYNQYSFTPSQDVFDIILLNGYDIRQVNVFGQVVNTISITGGDKTFRAYDVTGRIYVPSFGDDQFVYLGIIWVELPTIPTMGNIFNITYYTNIDSIPVTGNANQSFLFRRSIDINTTGSVNPGDKVEFRFFIDSGGVSQAYLNPYGSIKVVPTNGNLIANNIEVCVDQTQNAFYLNNNLSNFYGPSLFFNPLDSQVSASYGSLYEDYGDIFYPFSLEPNDKIVIQITNANGPILEYTVKSVVTVAGPNNTSFIYFVTYEDIDGYFGNLCSQYYKILFIKRIIDETSVILDFPKPEGKTSYGYIIPQNISPAVMANIDTINRNVNQQLVDVGVGVTT